MQRKANDGTELQDELAKALVEYTKYNKGFHHRFPDTKSAGGNFLKAQPGDFMLLVPGQSLLIECKSTVAGATLLSLAHHGKVGKNQIAKHRLWHRSGHRSLYLYGDMTEGYFAWHSGQDVVRKIDRPIFGGPIRQLKGSLPDLLIRIMDTEHEITI